MSIFGIAKKGFGKALTHGKNWKRARRISRGKRGKTISSVKPMSGKTPWWVTAGGKNPEKRAAIVKTHFSNVRSDKISKAEKQIKEGKKTLKKMIDTGQAEEIGEGGKYGHMKKGFNN
jgi:hypothetical protein